jgi:hypothetical protein
MGGEGRGRKVVVRSRGDVRNIEFVEVNDRWMEKIFG